MSELNRDGRIATFDILRGYFLFVIMIDHIHRPFGFWELFTGRGGQWVSAAEGFFFVSGIMIGIVRGRKMIGEPISIVFKKCWSRALTLYLWSIGLTALFSLVALHFSGNPGLKPDFFTGDLSSFIGKTLTLRFSYGWADFLNFYAVYLLVAPLAIYLLRKKLWHAVIITSFIVWSQTMTMMGGWQIIFFTGLVAGFNKDSIEAYFSSLSAVVKRYLVFTVYTLTVASLALSVFFTSIAEEFGMHGSNKLLGLDLSGAAQYSVNVLRPIFNKEPMESARLLLFYLWFTAAYIFVSRREPWIKDKLGWFLVTLGKNSLYVYIVSALLLFFFNLVVPFGQPWLVNVAISTTFLGIVWCMTKRRVLFKITPR